jgi:hypothetical protein
LIESNSTIFQLATKKTLSITDCKKNGVKEEKMKKERNEERKKVGEKKEERNYFVLYCLPQSFKLRVSISSKKISRIKR